MRRSLHQNKKPSCKLCDDTWRVRDPVLLRTVTCSCILRIVKDITKDVKPNFESKPESVEKRLERESSEDWARVNGWVHGQPPEKIDWNL